MIVLDILQFNLVAQTVGGILPVGKHKVQHPHGIDIIQMVVPLLTLHRLLTDGEGRVIDATVLEILLLSLLHLNDETAAVARHAVHIEHCAAVTVAFTEILCIQILNIQNLLLPPVEQRIQETDEQILVHLGTEQLLEAEVGVGVDVAARIHFAVSFLCFTLLLHNTLNLRVNKSVFERLQSYELNLESANFQPFFWKRSAVRQKERSHRHLGINIPRCPMTTSH